MTARIFLAALVLAATAATSSAALADTPFVSIPPDAPNFPRPMPARVAPATFWQVIDHLLWPKLGVVTPPQNWI